MTYKLSPLSAQPWYVQPTAREKAGLVNNPGLLSSADALDDVASFITRSGAASSGDIALRAAAQLVRAGYLGSAVAMGFPGLRSDPIGIISGLRSRIVRDRRS